LIIEKDICLAFFFDEVHGVVFLGFIFHIYLLFSASFLEVQVHYIKRSVIVGEINEGIGNTDIRWIVDYYNNRCC